MPVFETKIAGFEIKLLQFDFDKFSVQYGKQVEYHLSYSSAAEALGLAIMHASAAGGLLAVL